MNEKISVIIPVFNAEKYLKDCIDSVINQTYKNIECILLNDGSVDNSGKICDEYAKKDNRINVIHKKNSGVSDTRNMGISVSTGDYITFLDSDDWLEIDCFEKLLKTINKENPEVLAYGIDIRNETGEFLSNVDFESSSLENDFIRYPVYMNSMCNKLIKRSVLSDCNIQLEPNMIVCEDLLFVFNLMVLTKNHSFLTETYYHYRTNPSSATHRSMTEKKINDLYKCYKEITDICQRLGIVKEHENFLRYLNINATINYLTSIEYFSLIKFRELTLKRNYWKFSRRLDYAFISFCSLNHIDFIPKLYINLKKLVSQRKEKN